MAQARPDPYPHVPADLQQRIRDQSWHFCKHQRELGNHKARRAHAQRFAEQSLAEAEERLAAAARKVQPVGAGNGLVVPRQSLLITPDEARKIANRR